MKYQFVFTSIDRWNVEIEAESREKAEERFWDKGGIENTIDPLSPDDHDESLEPNGNESAQPQLFKSELLRLSDCILQAIANNNRAASLVFDPAIIRQIEAGNKTLRDLNSKICSMMKGNE